MNAGTKAAPLVLVVDDDAGLRRVLQATLEHYRYRVLTAGDGLEALQVLEQKRPDVILLDIDMPKLDGETLALKLRSHPDWHAIPLVMLTGLSGLGDQHLMATLGAAAYLQKPCPPEELVSAIQRAVP